MKILFSLLVLLGSTPAFSWDVFATSVTTSFSSEDCIDHYYYCKAVADVARGVVNGESLTQFTDEVQLLTEGGIIQAEFSDDEKMIAILEIHMKMISEKLNK